jgi:serine protease AprX
MTCRLPVTRRICRDLSGWRPADGLCPACVCIYAQELAAERSRISLHPTVEPHATFPYYHPEEETVLGQPERLPDYATFGGRGVTIAFLDSGYYPHPDLTLDDPQLRQRYTGWLSEHPRRLHCLLTAERRAELGLRLVEYVDLSDGRERTGLDLPSLWDGAGNSWHGQMTTTLAAGNGLLSGGRLRAYAPQAQLLPIKIGRRSGRIPEKDILAGLQWLLRHDNWRRFGVRVLNVAVGGDFLQPWEENPVCLAAEELSARGVLICAAAGNSGRAALYAPAQTPSVLTVGGYEDQNLRWQGPLPASLAQFTLYPTNHGAVLHQGNLLYKPEILALARWAPAPILPNSPVLHETVAIHRLRTILLGYDEQTFDGVCTKPANPTAWLPEVWEGVRKRMNAHKWVHPYYQHVDGTSVAVAQVSAVAAQMFEANPHLSAQEVRSLLLASAMPLPNQPAHLTGKGVVQPALAVAAALRAPGGRLAAHPRSAITLSPAELQKWQRQGKVSYSEIVDTEEDAGRRPCYFGYYAPHARAVSLVGSFNRWRPGACSLFPATAGSNTSGWWHGIVLLPPGQHLYRFWIEYGAEQAASWHPDPENPARSEGGYDQDHSFIAV